MKTQLYSILNRKAKSWWYHRKLREQGRVREARERERHSIKENVRILRLAIKHKGFLICGRGGWTLYYGPWNRLESRGGTLEDAIPQACLLLGIPILDTTTIPDRLLVEAIRLPTPRVGIDPTHDAADWAEDYASFQAVAPMYAQFGAKVYNSPA